MPRLPVDGNKVVEHRITFGTKERELIADLSTSYRISSLRIPETLEFLDDPEDVIQLMYSIATIAEILGIETGLPTVADIPAVVDWFTNRDLLGQQTSESGNPSILTLLTDFLTGSGQFEGMIPGGY
tara:strand:+ start:426 stop:806 length:381 start_codon:yes stop_codon:yes gene_type:complete